MRGTKGGFTLIELILVVSIMSLLVAVYASVGTSFLVRNSATNSTNQLLSQLRVAQLNSMSSKGDSSWGVSLQSGNIVLFKGSSYASRDQTFDEKFVVGSVSVTPFEVIFEKITGNTTPTTINITDNLGESHAFSINEVGSIDVN